MENKHYIHCKRALKEIKERLSSENILLAAFGSSIYGKPEGRDVKPNRYSDVDMNLIIEDKIPYENLEGLLNQIDQESLDLFLDKKIDILCLRGSYEQRPLSFQCMNKDTLDRLILPDDNPLIVYKERKDKLKKVNFFYDYDIFGLNKKSKARTRIIQYGVGNIIIYNNTNFPFREGDFYLTPQQCQILTEEEILDEENYLRKKREDLKKTLKLKFTNENLLDFFRYDKENWSKKFQKEMEKRLK